VLTQKELETLRHLQNVATGLQRGIEKLLEQQSPAEPKERKRRNLKQDRVSEYEQMIAAGHFVRKPKAKN
jgi:hypothetical protein